MYEQMSDSAKALTNVLVDVGDVQEHLGHDGESSVAQLAIASALVNIAQSLEGIEKTLNFLTEHIVNAQ